MPPFEVGERRRFDADKPTDTNDRSEIAGTDPAMNLLATGTVPPSDIGYGE